MIYYHIFAITHYIITCNHIIVCYVIVRCAARLLHVGDRSIFSAAPSRPLARSVFATPSPPSEPWLHVSGPTLRALGLLRPGRRRSSEYSAVHQLYCPIRRSARSSVYVLVLAVMTCVSIY